MFNVILITHYRVPNRDFADFSINFYRVDDPPIGGSVNRGVVVMDVVGVGVPFETTISYLHCVNLTTNYRVAIKLLKKCCQLLGVPGRSPSPVLTWPYIASRRSSDGILLFRCSMVDS